MEYNETDIYRLQGASRMPPPMLTACGACCKTVGERNNHGHRNHRRRSLRHGGGAGGGGKGTGSGHPDGAAGPSGTKDPGHRQRTLQFIQSSCRCRRLPRRAAVLCGLRHWTVSPGSGAALVPEPGLIHRGGGIRTGVPLFRSGQFRGGYSAVCPGKAEYHGEAGL